MQTQNKYDLMIFGDLHLRWAPPVYRVDNYYESLKEKLDFIFSIPANYYICLGDFFDKPDPSYLLLNDFMSFMRDKNVNLITLVGNHDIFYNRLSSWSCAGLGVLEKGDILSVMFGLHVLNGYNVYFLNWKDSLPNNINVDLFLTHNPIINNLDIIFNDDCIDIDEFFANVKAKYVFVGHLHHKKQRYISVEDSRLIYTESVCRLTTLYEDMSHLPRCYGVYRGNDGIMVDEILVPCKDFKTIFNLEERNMFLMQTTTDEKNVENIAKSIDSFKDMTFLRDIRDSRFKEFFFKHATVGTDCLDEQYNLLISL